MRSIEENGASLHVRTPIARFPIILGELAKRPRTARHIAAVLEVSAKTVNRDIDYMRDMLNLPIKSNGLGYELAAPVCVCGVCAGAAKSEEGMLKPAYKWSGLPAPREKHEDSAEVWQVPAGKRLRFVNLTDRSL